jgi:hypothetical protein
VRLLDRLDIQRLRIALSLIRALNRQL